MGILVEGRVVADRSVFDAMPPTLRKRARAVVSWADRNSPTMQKALRDWAASRGLICETVPTGRRTYALLIHHGFAPGVSDRAACFRSLATLSE